MIDLRSVSSHAAIPHETRAKHVSTTKHESSLLFFGFVWEQHGGSNIVGFILPLRVTKFGHPAPQSFVKNVNDSLHKISLCCILTLGFKCQSSCLEELQPKPGSFVKNVNDILHTTRYVNESSF